MNKKNIIFIAISIVVSLLVYLPTPKRIELEDFNSKHPEHISNLPIDKNKIDNAQFIITPQNGVEDIEIDNKGFIYSGLSDGSIIRINPENTSEIIVLAKSEGPIYGIDINSKNTLIALADQTSGIKILDLQTNIITPLVSEFNGSKFISPNAVVFGKNDEELYFTVSSEKIKMGEFHEILLYGENSGKIFSYNFETAKMELLADNLYFVNGLEYSHEENCLYFVETSRSRLIRMQLEGPKRGKTRIILDNIFGYPDNVKTSESGDLWIGIPTLRDSFTHILDQNSLFRKILINLRVPLSLFLDLINTDYSGGIKVSKKGEILEYIFGESKKIDFISAINEKNGKIYLTSPTTNKIAVVDLRYGNVDTKCKDFTGKGDESIQVEQASSLEQENGGENSGSEGKEEVVLVNKVLVEESKENNENGDEKEAVIEVELKVIPVSKNEITESEDKMTVEKESLEETNLQSNVNNGKTITIDKTVKSQNQNVNSHNQIKVEPTTRSNQHHPNYHKQYQPKNKGNTNKKERLNSQEEIKNFEQKETRHRHGATGSNYEKPSRSSHSNYQKGSKGGRSSYK